MNHRTLLAVLTLLGPLAPAGARAEAAPAAVPGPVKVRAVRTAAEAGTRTIAATVRAAERATLSTRVAANVRAVHVREGDRVRAGQLLVSLAADDLAGALRAAESALAAASAQERRIRVLAAERAATPAELDVATSQRAQAQAAVAAARANLSYAAIRAPFAGTVQARRVEPGDLVGPGQPLLDLEGDGLELAASLSEAEARGVAVGRTVRFSAGTVKGEAVVVALTPGGDPLSHRRGLRARIGRADPSLRSGAFARLLLEGAPEAGEAARTFVPRSAIVERGDLTGVYVAAGGHAELRWISPGEASGDVVAVRAGLRPDETVIDAPGALRDGQAVEVVR